jgi:hypothetical protein
MAHFTKNVPDMDLWSQSIGGLVINFGCLEFQTLRWIHVLGGEEEVIKARNLKLWRRIDAALALLAKSTISLEERLRARDLWAEVKRLSQIRNQIAHSPLVQGRNLQTDELVFSAVDLKTLTPNGQNEQAPLSHVEIRNTALRAGDINRQLSGIIEGHRVSG